MKIKITHCNNIDFAEVNIDDNRLNIKFAPNGTGKSTIARAILTAGNKDIPSKLDALLPFKLRDNNPDDLQPGVEGLSITTEIMCFDEEYVNQFVFRPDELVSNSFEIFVRDESYVKREKEIAELVREIKSLFLENKELEFLIDTLKSMADAFKSTKKGLSKSSSGMKGLSAGNKIEHIPDSLQEYTPFIRSENSVDWIDWQIKGYRFLDLASQCPFCVSSTKDRIEYIKGVGEEYDKNIIKNLIAIVGVIEKLGEFFSPEAKERLLKITKLKHGLATEHENSLVTVKNQIDSFLTNLERLRGFSAFDFKDGGKVAEVLPAYKLDLQFFSELDSERMRSAVKPINDAIDAVLEKAGLLQGKINQQLDQMRRTIQRHQQDINDFLAYAGYRYKVEIVGEAEKSQLRLRHLDHAEHLSGGGQHLSFGEKNAFALVLFMYECLSKKPDLIILDDPVSSFDKNKKYAILEMLFRRDASVCLKDRTVLMLTHDVEPIIDTCKSLSQIFQNHTSATFLKLRDGQITEHPITRDDIQIFPQICKQALQSDKHVVVKLIYLRRSLEISDDKGDAYQVLSNLLHKRDKKIDTRESKDSSGNYPEMDVVRSESGTKQILESIPEFDYDGYLACLNDTKAMVDLYIECPNGYEKLQIFRLLDLSVDSSVIRKFVNATYHVENEFICQLNPSEFDTIPEYVIDECDRILREIGLLTRGN